MPEDAGAPRPLARGMSRRRHGRSREGETAQYVIRAPYSRWKDVVHGDLEPVGHDAGQAAGAGDLPTIVRYVRAARSSSIQQVATTFPDEA